MLIALYINVYNIHGYSDAYGYDGDGGQDDDYDGKFVKQVN
jgi:hypothetical protein